MKEKKTGTNFIECLQYSIYLHRLPHLPLILGGNVHCDHFTADRTEVKRHNLFIKTSLVSDRISLKLGELIQQILSA